MTTQANKNTEKKKESSEKSPPKISILEGMNIKDLSMQLGIQPKNLLYKLSAKGISLGVNDTIDESIARIISELYKFQLVIVPIEEYLQTMAENDTENLIPKPPVVTIMGHVDHGKTTLLDSIRKSNLVKKESGGITQHIGAYRIEYKDHPITFIDTPGHEAFTQLRARGANLTDIVVLIVAADDGVMPQTREAINHAKAAGVPIIVAINKIDKANADIDKAKQQLSKEGLLVEDWGGDVISVNISALENTNLNDLLEMILLLSEVSEIKGNPNVNAQGVILEARLDARKGPVATIIIQHGTLHLGEAFISGICYGKARALFDEHGNPMEEAEISDPVEVLGFSDVPTAGDYFAVVNDVETAKKISQFRQSQIKKKDTRRPEHLTLDQLFKEIEEGEAKELLLIIKADVQGSVEVLQDLLPNLSTDKVKIKITHAATGKITESDVLLASASNAIIIGYNTKTSQSIIDLAKEENVEIRQYNIIYQLTDDIKKAIKGLLEPEIREIYLGKAEVRRIFTIPKVGVIAGCLVTDGKIQRNAEVRIIRDNQIIHKGKISSLKHLKNNVSEVKKDYECGIGITHFKELEEGDVIEAYHKEKVKPE